MRRLPWAAPKCFYWVQRSAGPVCSRCSRCHREVIRMSRQLPLQSLTSNQLLKQIVKKQKQSLYMFTKHNIRAVYEKKSPLKCLFCIILPFWPVCTSGLEERRPPALPVQNCSCSKLCLMSQPLSLSREPTSAGLVLTSSAKHSSCR